MKIFKNRSPQILALLLLLIAFSTAVFAEENVVEVADEAGTFETLLKAAKAAELAHTLQEDGPFTVFAPTDDAFARLPSHTLQDLLKPENKEKLATILKYHVIAGKVAAKDALQAESAETLAGDSVSISIRDGRLAVNDANVILNDVEASNGIIHVIDSVLMPPAPKNIVETAAAAGNFKTLLGAVEAAGLVETLEADGPFTVLAPSDKAFGKLGEETLASLLKPERKAELQNLLKYHLIPGRLTLEDIEHLKAVKTAQGAKVLVVVDAFAHSGPGLAVNQSNIISGDIESANGIIHVVDSVLMPPADDKSNPQDTSHISHASSSTHSGDELLKIKEQDKHLVHVQELDCPLPASWQYRIYIPKDKSAPLFRSVTGVCEGGAFADDKLNVTASVPVPLVREQFVLSITIRRAGDGEYKCYAYIVGPKNADFHEIALPAVDDLKVLTDPREKYFKTARRVMARGTRNKEVKRYQPGAAIPLVLLKPDEKSSGEASAKAADSFPAVWLRVQMPAASEDSSTVMQIHQEKARSESPETVPQPTDKQRLRKALQRSPQLRGKLVQEAEKLGNSDLVERIRSGLPEDEGKEAQALARAMRLAEEEDWNAACDAYFEVFRSNPNLFGAYPPEKQIDCFQKAGRLIELAQFFDRTMLQRIDRTNYGLKELVVSLIDTPETRYSGYELLERVFRYNESVADLLLREYDYKRFWKSVPDPVFLLRCWLLPEEIEKRGWDSFGLAAIDEDEGSYSNRLTKARPLLVDPKALQRFADELREKLQTHPKWTGGWALLGLFEGEIGNYREAAQLINDHILKSDPSTIPTVALWTLGDFLQGKGEELDDIAVKLLESAVSKLATNPEHDYSLRASPINLLAKAYTEDSRDQEARQLLYGLVDPVNQHPLVKGYAGNKSVCRLGNQCITCHRNDRETIRETEFGGFYDAIKMSEAMTDIGYPVDTLVELARTDATFRNAFSSSRGWVDTSSEKGKYFEGRLSNRKFSIGFEYDEQTSKARSAVTPRKVIEALETDTFYRSTLRDEASIAKVLDLIRNASGDDEENKALRELARSSQQQENNKNTRIDLMASVRGEGPDAQATVFSPVIDILKLAGESKEADAAKDIAELDKRLVELSEQHPQDIGVGITATVFAFLRNDLDSAEDRVKRLQAITDYPESDGIALWLAARHALRHEQTRILGEVLTERALTAGENLPDTRFREAILRERSGLCAK